MIMDVEGYCEAPNVCFSEKKREDACRGCPANIVEKAEKYLLHLRKCYPKKVKTDG